MRTERGQALVELALGMLALALVTSALAGFAVYMVKSLEVQNSARSSKPVAGGAVHVGITFGTAVVETLEVKEDVKLPPLELLGGE